MCEASIYVFEDGREELLIERANIVVPKEDGSIYIEDIFGQRKTILGTIKKMELVDHRIIVER